MSEQIELLVMKDDAATSDSDEVCPDRSEGTINSPEGSTTVNQKYRTYHRRWYMLFSLSILSLSNGMVILYDFVCTRLVNCVGLDVVDLCSHSK